MRKRTNVTIEVDGQGRFLFPAEAARRLGLIPGAKVCLEADETGLRISHAMDRLARIYIEPTNACNLDCSTCMRNVWEEPLGRMAWATFQRVLDGALSFSPLPSIFFGGFGEPLAHSAVFEMIAAARRVGCETELITNGTLIDETAAARLVEAGLKRIWVSIDGASPQSYADVRLGDMLPQVIVNLERLAAIRERRGAGLPRLGIAFVAMRRNIADLPDIILLGRRLGADRFSISNVLPHTAEIREQMLYEPWVYNSDLPPSQWSPEIAFPRMDLDASTVGIVAQSLQGRGRLGIARQHLRLGANACPFLEKGSLSVRWDGAVSPCLPLMHTHQSYLGEHLRFSHSCSFGSVRERSLAECWHDPRYAVLRQRLQSFDFSPCTFCNSCEMAQANLEDCFGNVHPTCGGCLWAQGYVQCP